MNKSKDYKTMHCSFGSDRIMKRDGGVEVPIPRTNTKQLHSLPAGPLIFAELSHKELIENLDALLSINAELKNNDAQLDVMLDGERLGFDSSDQWAEFIDKEFQKNLNTLRRHTPGVIAFFVLTVALLISPALFLAKLSLFLTPIIGVPVLCVGTLTLFVSTLYVLTKGVNWVLSRSCFQNCSAVLKEAARYEQAYKDGKSALAIQQPQLPKSLSFSRPLGKERVVVEGCLNLPTT